MKVTIVIFLSLLLVFPSLQAQVIQRQGKDKAVFFAVSDYDRGTGWKDLTFPIQEAEKLAKLLRDNFGFEAEVVKNPTKADVFKKLKQLKNEEYAEDGQLLLFFSGHGVVFDDSLGAFVTREVKQTEAEWNALPYVHLKPKIDAINCQHILLMIDACHSGALFIGQRDDNPKKPKWMRKQSLAELQKVRITELMTRETYRYGMTSGAIHETTPDHSAFAQAFYNGLLEVQRNGQAYTTLKHIWRENMTTIKPLPQQGKYSYHHLSHSSFFFFYNRVTSEIKFEEQPLKGKVVLTNYWKAGGFYIDGQFKKQLTLGAVEFELPIGEYSFEIRQADQRKWQRSVFIKEGVTKLVTTIPSKEMRSNGNTKRDLLSAPEMVYIEGGSFTMGCTTEQEGCSDDEKPVHQISLGSYWMGKTEVTNEEFCVFLNSYGSDRILSGTYKGEKMVYEHKWGIKKVITRWEVQQGYESYPIINVTWYGAVSYAVWLSKQTGQNYRLLTEAEWEYAARGGNLSKGYKYAGSDDASEVAWYGDYNKENNIPSYGTKQIGLKAPNALGLYDMSGNVWEWCHDWYGSYTVDSKINLEEIKTGSYRVMRGGSWVSSSKNVRITYRNFDHPDNWFSVVGFRLCLPQL